MKYQENVVLLKVIINRVAFQPRIYNHHLIKPYHIDLKSKGK